MPNIFGWLFIPMDYDWCIGECTERILDSFISNTKWIKGRSNMVMVETVAVVTHQYFDNEKMRKPIPFMCHFQ